MAEPLWHDIGPVDELRRQPLREVRVGRTRVALSCVAGRFGAISGVCNHAGGPVGQGRLDGEYVVCPWHNWKYHYQDGRGEPGFEEDALPSYELKVEDGHLWIRLEPPATRRSRKPHAPHPLSRPLARAPGPVRVVGISSTVMDAQNPRYSTSDALLECALDHAATLGVETRMIRLNQLRFRACEGYYSKSAHACTWPCSITQMDPRDEMEQVYEAMVFWADVILLASPIRWGSASSLYFKMIERMNCVQNQITIRKRVMLRNKVASFIITGGQDNVQAVAGQMLMFFSELGCHFPQFPFIAHSRGWSAEDMERNVSFVRESAELHAGARELVERAIEHARLLLAAAARPGRMVRAGRKASGAELEMVEGRERGAPVTVR